MSLDDCPFCTGSRWLADQKEAGPCVCCSPENMVALEAELVGANAAAEDRDQLLADRNEAMAILGEAGDQLALYLVSLGLSGRALKADNEHLDALINLLGD